MLIYSRGLESFFGEDTGDEGDSTAGIAVQLLGITLRPIVFFSGSGDLMSMAWSLGSASSDSSYSAIKGLILLQDHGQVRMMMMMMMICLEPIIHYNQRHCLTRSIRDSETSIDFVQGPPGSRRERVNIVEAPFKKLNFDVCVVWWCSDGPINSQETKLLKFMQSISRYLWLNITTE